jgi:hypothetical protein
MNTPLRSGARRSRARSILTLVLLVVCCGKSNASYCPGANLDEGCPALDAGSTCTLHDECPDSNACLPDGSCAAVDDVAYIAPAPAGTDNTTCRKALPCTTFVRALATNRMYIKLRGALSEAVGIQDRRLIMLADPGTTLTRAAGGNILVLGGTSHVEIYDLAIHGVRGNGAIAISLPAGGSQSLSLTRVTLEDNRGLATIQASGGTVNLSGCTLRDNNGGAIMASNATVTIQQSTLSNNWTSAEGAGAVVARNATLHIRQSVLNTSVGIGVAASSSTVTIQQSTLSGNTAGGVSLASSSFDLQDNVITRNGSVASDVGGVLIDRPSGAMHRIEFNTITQNEDISGLGAGVICQLVAQPLSFNNNIVYGNRFEQVLGPNCSWSYSDIGPDPVSGTVSGTGNLNVDPHFVDPAEGNYHLQASSPLIDHADPGATLAMDIDGDPRPRDGRSDIGADEYTP